MSLSIGIVGLPNAGKSTLFSALTKKQVEIANYPFATIDPSVGVVEVPDERLTTLANISNSKQIVPTVVEFTDIAGLIKGASTGAGLGNQFLSHIQKTAVVLYVIRTFESSDIQHTEESVDPIRDIEILRSELAIKDIEIIEKRLQSLTKDVKRADKEKKSLEQEKQILEQWLEVLNKNIHIYEVMQHEQESVAQHLQLLTAKKVLYCFNAHTQEISNELHQYIGDAEYVIINAQAEFEAKSMTHNERIELGLETSGLEDLIHKAYKTLNLISFFTTGEKETRAWTIRENSTAPQAGGAIHSDFEDYFIRAEVIEYEKFVQKQGWSKAKQQGLVRTEGKEYVVQDGDVMLFLYNKR